MQEEEVLSIEQIKKALKDIKENKDKTKYIKRLLAKESYKDLKKDLTKELVPLILEDKKKVEKSYSLIYDSMNESLEPIYFWMLDFLRDKAPAGLGLDLWKGPEDFEASVTSGYFGEIGQRSSLMQQKAMEYLGTINNIINSQGAVNF